MPLEVIITEDYETLSMLSAKYVARTVSNKPEIVLGLATGSTPEGCYKELANIYWQSEICKLDNPNFSKVKTFNLDEYVGLDPTDPNSYNYYMNEKLFKHINIRHENTHVPNGVARDLRRYCMEYEDSISVSGGIDLQLLGIGPNGHIAFNEPYSAFASRTRVVRLTEETRKVNARFFNSIDEVPTEAITMGLGTIMEARKIVLLASGYGKASAIASSIEIPKTEEMPASILQDHTNVIFILDEEAASKLSYTKARKISRSLFEHGDDLRQLLDALA